MDMLLKYVGCERFAMYEVLLISLKQSKTV